MQELQQAAQGKLPSAEAGRIALVIKGRGEVPTHGREEEDAGGEKTHLEISREQGTSGSVLDHLFPARVHQGRAAASAQADALDRGIDPGEDAAVRQRAVCRPTAYRGGDAASHIF